MTQGQDFKLVTDANELHVSGSPLRRFWGKLEGWKPRYEQEKGFVDVQFSEVEVIESTTPYAFAIAVLSFNYRPTPEGWISDRSLWGRFLASGKALGFPKLETLKTQRLLMTGSLEQFVSRDGRAGTMLVWTVAEIQGVAKPTIGSVPVPVEEDSAGLKKAEALELAKLADGKTAGEFAQAALQNETGRKYQAELFGGTLIPGLIALKLLEQKGDRYYLTAADKVPV